MDSRRRGKISGKVSMGAGKSLIWVLRTFFCLQEYTAPPERKQKLRAFRGKMDGIERDHATIQRLIKEDPQRSFEISSEFLKRFSDDETKQFMAESRRKIKAIEEEVDTLFAMHQENKDNPERSVTAFQQYAEAHPDSELAFSYLGSALEVVQNWDASLAAHREAERLAVLDRISGISERLHIGQVLHHKWDFSAAVTQYHSVITDAKREGTHYSELAYLYLGNVLNEHGNRREARSACGRAAKNKLLAPKARKLPEANP